LPKARPTLIIMVKEPVAGRVKTRLGRDIGMTAAAWWFRHQTRRLIRRLRDPRWDLVLAVSPDRDGMTSRFWPADIPRMPQGRGDLGARMARLLSAVPDGPVCLIGGDIPKVTPAHIRFAFDKLQGRDFIFGPAADGGFWLVGARLGQICRPKLFDGVTWSVADTLAQTVARMDGWAIGYCDVLHDVDELCDLQRLKRVLSAPVPPRVFSQK